MTSGIVYLVGAGPGDPGLLTLRGAEVLGRADVVLIDALANEALLAHARPGAEVIYVGKRGPPHQEERPWEPRRENVAQSETTALLVHLAREGKTVVRLKGGDPFVFGRGGEEADALAEAGVAFEVVPGITSAVAAPAYAGIPVTHRDATSTLAIVTGHEEPGKDESAIDWEALARMGTVVFLMGVTHLAENMRRLAAAGLDPATPAAAIEWGTYPRQRTIRATVGTLAERAVAAGLGAPSVVVVGAVCRRSEALDWFSRRPLRGRRIVVPRTRRQAGGFCARLRDLGAEPIEVPAIEVRPLDPAPAVAALRRGGWSWIVFTSANGAEAVAVAMEGAGLDARAFAGARIAAIGPATGRALLETLRIRADVVPEAFVAEALLERLGDVRGKRLLLLRARAGRTVLPEGLRAAGAEVEDIPVYETASAVRRAEDLRARLEAREVDAIAFTSSSTVEALVEALRGSADLLRRSGAVVASIGPATSATARLLGLDVSVEAARHDVEGLVEALVRRLGPRPTP